MGVAPTKGLAWPAWLALATGMGLMLALGDWPRFAVSAWAAWVLGVHVVAGVAALLALATAWRHRPVVAATVLTAGVAIWVTGWLGRGGDARWAWSHALVAAAFLTALGSVAPTRRVGALIAAVAIVVAGLWQPAAAPPPEAAPSVARVRAGGPVAALPEAAAECGACHGAVTGPVHAQHPTGVGCAACHRGDPYASDADVAHGLDPGIRRPPLLAGAFAQATCSGCHAPHGPPAGAEAWARGATLWAEGGCAGCHDSGGRLGPDLDVLAWAWNVAPMSSTGAAWAAAGWPPHAAFLGEAIRAPLTHVPVDVPAEARPAHMPAYPFDDLQIRDLTIYLLSLAAWNYPASLSGPSPAPEVDPRAVGEVLYHDPEIGCALCHRLRGAGGELGPSLDAWQGRDPAVLAALIADPERTRVDGYPPLMPRDYGTRLDPAELLAIAVFVTANEVQP